MAKGLDILDVNRARKINLCGRQLKILHGFIHACLQRARERDHYYTRLLCPWDSPGKNTGVGKMVIHCSFDLQGVNA